jgi:CheY-like chemotaxis protein
MSINYYSILVVDRDPIVRIVQRWFFGSLGHAVDAVPDVEQALLWLATHPCHLVLAEAGRPEAGGPSLAYGARACCPSVKVVLRTNGSPEVGLPSDLVVEETLHLVRLRDMLDDLMRQAGAEARGQGGLESA